MFRIPVIVLLMLISLPGVVVVRGVSGSDIGPMGIPSVGYSPGWPVDVGLAVDRSSPAVGDLDGDPELEIVVGTAGHQIFAFNPDGSLVPGWPVTVPAEVNSSPAIGDLNGDGWNEVVVGVGWQDLQNDGGIYAFSHDGNLMPGWPVISGDENLGPNGHPDGVFSSPALADLTGDGYLEVIVGGFDQYVYAIRYDGTHVPGWPVFLWDSTWASPAVGDLDRDGDLEVAIGAYTHHGFPPGLATVDGGGIFWLLSADGSVEPGWPRVFDLHFDSSPALGDLDGDGDLEIVVGTGHEPGTLRGRHVYAWHHNGEDVAGWPVSTQAYVWPSPALGDLDGDGLSEVVISCVDGYLYAWDGNGASLPGWPVRPTNESDLEGGMVGSPIVVDLDGNGDMEIMTPIGWDLVAYNHDGSPFRYGSEPQLRMHTMFSVGGTPAVADVDQDGHLEVFVGSAEFDYQKGRLFAWELPALIASDTSADGSWAMFRRDSARRGLAYREPVLVVSHETISIMVEVDSVSFVEQALSLRNGGDGILEWSIEQMPATFSAQVLQATAGGVPAPLDPQSLQGIADDVPVTLHFTVPVGMYQTGEYGLGSIVISATSGGYPVLGSPITIPVKLLVVDEMSQLFVPLLSR